MTIFRLQMPARFLFLVCLRENRRAMVILVWVAVLEGMSERFSILEEPCPKHMAGTNSHTNVHQIK